MEGRNYMSTFNCKFKVMKNVPGAIDGQHEVELDAVVEGPGVNDEYWNGASAGVVRLQVVDGAGDAEFVVGDVWSLTFEK